MPTFDAILPAGGKIDADFAKIAGTDNKALITLGDRTILGRTLDVLAETGMVRSTVVIGPDEVRNHPDCGKATFTLPPADTGPDNIFLGLQKLMTQESPPDKILIVTTDLPFLSPEAIVDFVNRCPANKELCVPLIREADFHKRFPGTTATFVQLKDDSWTTGNVFMMSVPALQKAKPHIDKVFANRKSKSGMAKLLGPVFVLKWLTKRLTLADVEGKIVSMLGCSGAAITKSAPELHYDIDALDDYEYTIAHQEENRPVTAQRSQ